MERLDRKKLMQKERDRLFGKCLSRRILNF